MQKYDIGIIGAGSGGYKAALRAAQNGKKVCVIDKNMQTIGGVCINEGCIPTKSLINSVNILNLLSKANEVGIEAVVKRIDKEQIVKASQEAVEKLKQGLLYLFKKNNIDLIEGIANLLDKKHIQISSLGKKEKIEVDNIIIATGSRTKAIPGIKIDGKRIITSSEAVKLNKIPNELLIIGGGAIGVEFADIYNSLGTDVTVVEMMDQLLPTEDKDIINQLQRNFRKKGINVLTGSKIKNVDFENDKIIAEIESKSGVKNLKTELVLTAVGRVPNTKQLKLENIGISLDKRNFIMVDKNMQTSVSKIYAVGDVVNSPLLAHVAFEEARLAVDSILDKVVKYINYENIPNVVYLNPEIASVGLTEEEIKDRNFEYKVGKCFYKSNGRAIVSKKEEGFIKVIADKESEKILGVHIIGAGASEIIHEYAVAKQNGVSIKELSKTVHAHPTLSEMAVDVSESLIWLN